MQNSENLPILIIIALFVVLYFIMSKRETFSSSGLAVSDRYCQQLADVYYMPRETSADCRHNYRKRICGHPRRNTVDFNTGNYFTENGQLV